MSIFTIIPNLFRKNPHPKIIPLELDKKIKEFSKSKNKEIFLQKSFRYVTNRWYGHRGNLFLKFNRVFYRDINKIFNSKGYMHCTNMAYILRIMAVRSGLFKEEDIKLKLTLNYAIFIHQYLKIKISKNKYIKLDPWAYQFGIDYGDYSHGFGKKEFYPIMKRINSNKLLMSKNIYKN